MYWSVSDLYMMYELKSSTYILLLCFDNVLCHNYVYTSCPCRKLIMSYQTNQLGTADFKITASRRSFYVASFLYTINLLIPESREIAERHVTPITEVTV